MLSKKYFCSKNTEVFNCKIFIEIQNTLEFKLSECYFKQINILSQFILIDLVPNYATKCLTSMTRVNKIIIIIYFLLAVIIVYC